MDNQNIDENFEKSLELLTEWYTQQPHLPQRYVGNFLRSFLTGCKMSIERSKKKLDNYFYYRNLYPDVLRPPDISKSATEKLFLKRASVILPKCTPEGHRVHIVKFCGDSDLDPKVQMQMTMMSLEVASIENSIKSGGVIIILDLQEFTFKHTLQQIFVAKYNRLIQDVSPFQSKGVILVNATKFTEKGISFYRAAASEKLRQRLHVVPAGQNEKLHEFVPAEILPKEYGGEEESFYVIREEWFKKLQYYYKTWLWESKNITSDESKRPPHMKRNEDLVLGTDGSFKQLLFD